MDLCNSRGSREGGRAGIGEEKLGESWGGAGDEGGRDRTQGMTSTARDGWDFGDGILAGMGFQ